MNKDDAYLAINEPLEMAKSIIDHRVIEKLHENKVIYKLIEDLAKIKKETFRGQSFEIKGEFVDPLQLQVVCKRLWEKLKITQLVQMNDPYYFDFLGNIDKAMEDYYYDVIETAASMTGISQDKIRDWIETSLITSSEVRRTVYRESEKTGEIPNEAIQSC